MSTLADLPSGVVTESMLDFQITEAGTAGTMRFGVPALDLGNFLAAVAGINETITYPGGTSATRRIPLMHPAFPGCYAMSIRGGLRDGVCTLESPRGEPGSPTDHTSIAISDPSDRVSAYWVEVGFQTPKYEITNDSSDYPLVTEQSSSGIDFLPQPGSAYKWTGTNGVLTRDVPLEIITEEVSLTFHRVPALDRSTWRSLTGKVNSAVFYGCNAGTLLYLGYSLSGQSTLWGVTTFDVTHRFKWRSLEWIKIMREDGVIDIPVNRSTGNPIYTAANLGALWG